MRSYSSFFEHSVVPVRTCAALAGVLLGLVLILEPCVARAAATWQERSAVSRAETAAAKRFSRNVFAQPGDPLTRVQKTRPVVVQEKAEKAAAALEVRTRKQADQDQLRPRRHALPGSAHTLSQLEEPAPTEVAVRYALDESTSARLALNQQDETSPLYTPLSGKAKDLNAAGLYLDMQVADNLAFLLGGEVRNHEAELQELDGETSAGATVGIRWSF